jgi:hypothetical protein
MHSLRVVIGAAVLGILTGFLVQATPLSAAGRSADERIASAVEQVAGQMRELTRAVERSDRQIECKCKCSF